MWEILQDRVYKNHIKDEEELRQRVELRKSGAVLSSEWLTLQSENGARDYTSLYCNLQLTEDISDMHFNITHIAEMQLTNIEEEMMKSFVA